MLKSRNYDGRNSWDTPRCSPESGPHCLSQNGPDLKNAYQAQKMFYHKSGFSGFSGCWRGNRFLFNLWRRKVKSLKCSSRGVALESSTRNSADYDSPDRKIILVGEKNSAAGEKKRDIDMFWHDFLKGFHVFSMRIHKNFRLRRQIFRLKLWS